MKSVYLLAIVSYSSMELQWNLLIKDTFGTSYFILVERLSSFKGDFDL